MKNQTKLFASILLSVIYSVSFSQDCSNLFISEYVEGTKNSKALEIYNPTDEIIDLSRYHVARYSNGEGDYTEGGITQLQGFIHPKSVHVLVNGQIQDLPNSPSCDPDLQKLANQLDKVYPAPTYMNGNDAIALFYDTKGNKNPDDFIGIDLFGIIGEGMTKPDEGWSAETDIWIYKKVYENDVYVRTDSAKIINYIVPEGYYWIPWTANHTLVRKPNVLHGVLTEPYPAFVVTEEWDTLAGGADVWDSLGTHYCECENYSSLANNYINEFSIFPNPSKDELFITTNTEIFDFKLFSQEGKLLFSKTRNFEKHKKIRIDLNKYSPGFYIIQVNTSSGIIAEKVIIE